MNIKEVVDQVIELTDIPIDQFKARRYINDAMSILSSQYDTACIKNTTVITCIDIIAEYPLPSDCFGVYRVIFENQKFTDFTVEDNKIQFDYLGDFTIKYFVRPNLDAVKVYDNGFSNDAIPIHEAYHRAVCFYVAAEILPAKDDRIALYMNRFTTICNDVNSKLKREKRKSSRMRAPLFR